MGIVTWGVLCWVVKVLSLKISFQTCLVHGLLVSWRMVLLSVLEKFRGLHFPTIAYSRIMWPCSWAFGLVFVAPSQRKLNSTSVQTHAMPHFSRSSGVMWHALSLIVLNASATSTIVCSMLPAMKLFVLLFPYAFCLWQI